MLYTVTLRDVSRDTEKTIQVWASDTWDAMKRACGRCTRYQKPIRAERSDDR